MDRSWISKPRFSPEYVSGVEEFLDFAFSRPHVSGVVKCPCVKCSFKKCHTRDVMFDHLICNGFPLGYTIWLRHGEQLEDNAPPNPIDEHVEVGGSMQDLIHDAFRDVLGRRNTDEPRSTHTQTSEVRFNTTNEETCKFNDLINEENQELFEGCTKYSKLSFLVKLYHIKCLCRVSDKAMDMILELLRDAFENAKLPESYYAAKKTINKLGLSYKTIHACPNDCMLYWGDDAERDKCKTCDTSRWKTNTRVCSNDGRSANKKRKKKPAKVLRYFPLIPRLQRLFMSSKTAEHMRWHITDKNLDGLLRHPRDGQAWKSFDALYPEFSEEPRNVRLGLASDGFNPFGVMSTNYSIWPVLLIPYNFPPWMCMKQTSFMLSMIIPGKRMPGNDIDVYLQPLIKELQELWVDGVDTFDCSTNQVFKLRAALLWTISDFPGLGNLSGWNTYTGCACPSCNFDQEPHRLNHGRKWCFMGHRRFLPAQHRYRFNRNRFDGTIERREPPITPDGTMILNQLQSVNVTFGKQVILDSRRKRPHDKDSENDGQQWRKRSVFFELPYWGNNKLRHNLDVMHIEKNVCDNVLYTLLNEVGRTKDNLSARKDLQDLGIRPELWPDANGKFKPACFTMTNGQKDVFLQTLKDVIMPDGYASNISRCVDIKHRKISGLKSHDSHVLLEQLLPIALRNAQIDPKVNAVVLELCLFFRKLCSHVLDFKELDQLQEKIVVTLCQFEMLFPPSFFTIMVHLVVHLVDEARLGGPVHYRWMYPVER